MMRSCVLRADRGQTDSGDSDRLDAVPAVTVAFIDLAELELRWDLCGIGDISL